MQFSAFPNSTVRRVKISEELKLNDGNFQRVILFFTETEEIPDIKGKRSLLGVLNPVDNFPFYIGKTAYIPEGYEICGFRAWTNEHNEITWVDLKIWQTQTKT